jgi:hypothetical protein
MFTALTVLLLALALLSRSARAYAIVFALVTVGVWLTEWAQFNIAAPASDPLIFYKIPAYLDAFAFSGIGVIMITERLMWWKVAVLALSLVTVLYDVWFWFAYYLGASVGPEYIPLLQGLFLISLAVLVIGGYDVAARVGLLFASIRGLGFSSARFGGARRAMHKASVLEKRT